MKPGYKTLSFDIKNAVAPSVAAIESEMIVLKGRAKYFFVFSAVYLAILFTSIVFGAVFELNFQSSPWLTIAAFAFELVMYYLSVRCISIRVRYLILQDRLLPITAEDAIDTLNLCQSDPILARYQNAVINQGRELTVAELYFMHEWDDGAAQRQEDEEAKKALEALRSKVGPITNPQP